MYYSVLSVNLRKKNIATDSLFWFFIRENLCISGKKILPQKTQGHCFGFLFVKIRALVATKYCHRLTVLLFKIWYHLAKKCFYLFFLCICGKKILPLKTQIHCFVFQKIEAICYSIRCTFLFFLCICGKKILPQKTQGHCFGFLFVKICALVATKNCHRFTVLFFKK